MLWFSCHVLAFSARGTCTGSRYDRATRFLHCFQGLMGSARFSQLEQMLFTTKLLCPGLVKHTKELICRTYPQASNASLCCHVLLHGTRILTCFPFLFNSPLRVELGSAYSWSTSVAKKPVPFRRCRFSLQIDATSTKIFIAIQSTRLHKRASTRTARLPTKSVTFFTVPQYR